MFETWQKKLWVLTAIVLLIIAVLILFFTSISILKAYSLISENQKNTTFVFSMTALIQTTILRLLAEISGILIAFSGLIVSFYAQKQAIKVGGEISQSSGLNSKFSLATASPGIFSLVVGAVIITSALFSHTHYSYNRQGDRDESQSQNRETIEDSILPPSEQVFESTPSKKQAGGKIRE